MGLQESGAKIIENVGGAANINSFTHCATRLRFGLKDDSKANIDEIKSVKEVLDVVNKGGQLQVIIGPAVEKLYNEMTPMVGDAQTGEVIDAEAAAEDGKAKSKRGGWLGATMDYVSGAISPVLPILIGAGMINAVLALLTLVGLSKESGTYVALSAFANACFTYLPAFVAIGGARKLRTNEYLAGAIALIMITNFNQVEEMSLFGLAIPNIKFASCIIPALALVPLMRLLDKGVDKVLPAQLHFTLKPLIVFIVMMPVMLFILGPIGAAIGGALANMCIWLMEKVGPIALAVLSALHPITVMFGMHYLFSPVMVNELAETGYTFVLVRALAANFAIAGAAMAVGVKAKKAENKQVGISSAITALISVTEPALYGCLIRLRKPLIGACAGAAVAGAFCGIFKVRGYALASPNLLSLPIFIGEAGMSNFIFACLGAAIGFGLGFVFTWLMGFDED